MSLVVYCGACGRRFEGEPLELRATIWPHHATHRPEEFTRRTVHGEIVAFDGEPIVLSCNCGECDFCLAAARDVPMADLELVEALREWAGSGGCKCSPSSGCADAKLRAIVADWEAQHA